MSRELHGEYLHLTRLRLRAQINGAEWEIRFYEGLMASIIEWAKTETKVLKRK